METALIHITQTKWTCPCVIFWLFDDLAQHTTSYIVMYIVTPHHMHHVPLHDSVSV